MRNVQTKVVEKKNFILNNFFIKVVPFMILNVKKYDRATDDKMADVHCILDT
jgi:hypothetical protein